ncbi:RNA polymerase subunit sigma-70 [marine bacterium AO1-C]|nr:RNA polymerase subunit sigma-70 [marine bacterium AO1-C]
MSSEAFLELIDAHQNIIYKITRTYRDTREDQEDLFQEIVFQLWKSYGSFRQEAKISTWIYRIALNTAIAMYRKKKVAMNYQEKMPENIHPSDYQEISENEERMYQALRQLNDVEKAVVSLYLEDYSYQEIAQITGISENYVGVRINRIKQKLKKILTV